MGGLSSKNPCNKNKIRELLFFHYPNICYGPIIVGCILYKPFLNRVAQDAEAAEHLVDMRLQINPTFWTKKKFPNTSRYNIGLM